MTDLAEDWMPEDFGRPPLPPRKAPHRDLSAHTGQVLGTRNDTEPVVRVEDDPWDARD